MTSVTSFGILESGLVAVTRYFRRSCSGRLIAPRQSSPPYARLNAGAFVESVIQRFMSL